MGGAALTAQAWHRAWRSTLRVAFESIAHEARAESVRAGRQLPEDIAASVVIVGVLRSDAGLTASGGVSLALDAQWVGRVGSASGPTDRASNPVSGAVQLTVHRRDGSRPDARMACRTAYPCASRPASRSALSRSGRSRPGAISGAARHRAGRHREERLTC